jgi:hypothetical protein
MIFRRSPASSSFVLAAARLRALQLDPGRAAAGPGSGQEGIPKNSQPSPAARVVTGPGPYALLTVVALMGADERTFNSGACLPQSTRMLSPLIGVGGRLLLPWEWLTTS